MSNKKICVFISAVIAALVCGFFSVTAYAKTTPPYCECDNDCYTAEATVTIPTDPVPTPTPQTLTPQGNMTLVDDFTGELAADKQFITVVTRNGHFFYIVIDRAGERQNVHFLNQVDEYDLWAILEEEARPRTPPVLYEPMPEITPTPTPEADPQPADEQNGGIGNILVLLLIVGAIGGGAYYYFQVLKPQQAAKGKNPTEFSEFDFDEDEEDLDMGATTEEYSGADFDNDDIPDFTTTADSEDISFEEESEEK